MVNPGWYKDPTDGSILRWWDGAQWTSEVTPNPEVQQQPQPQPSGQPPPQQGYSQQAPWDTQQASSQQISPQQGSAGDWQSGENTSGFTFGTPAGNDGGGFGSVAPWDNRQTPPQQAPQQAPQQQAPWETQQNVAGGNPVFESPPWETQQSFSGIGADPALTPPPWGGQQGDWQAGGSQYDPQSAAQGGWQPEQQGGWQGGVGAAPAAQQGSSFNPLSGYEVGDGGYSGPAQSGNQQGGQAYGGQAYGGQGYDYDDDDDDDRTAKIKKLGFAGGVVIAFFVLVLIVRSLFGGGGDESATGDNEGQEQVDGGGQVQPPDQESESGVPLVNVPAWSLWPSVSLGYVVEYPTPPELTTAEDRQVFTSSFEGAQYQLVALTVNRDTIAALSGEERLAIGLALVREQNPDAPQDFGEASEASLGGLPARQVQWEREGGAQAVARFTFTANRVYMLTAIGPDSERFLNSFGWFREPPAL